MKRNEEGSMQEEAQVTSHKGYQEEGCHEEAPHVDMETSRIQRGLPVPESGTRSGELR